MPRLSQQIATRARSLDYTWLSGWLPNPDPILKAQGQDIAIYRDMRADAHVGGCIRRRKAAVKSLEWELERGKAPSRVHKACLAILEELAATPDPDEPGATPGLRALISDAMDGALYGYQPLEVTWGRSGSLIVPTVVQSKPPEWFQFDSENRLRFKARDGGLDGELLPAKKFLLARQDATYANPYGVPDMAMVYWPHQFRRAAKFWVQWLERHGGDFLIGKQPRSLGTQAETEAAYNDMALQLEAMLQDSVAVVPDDGSVEILASSSKGGSTDAHERFLLYWRGEISIALLGSNQGIETNSTNASATASLEVAQDIRDGDARMIEAVVNQLLRWVVAVNWQGQEAPVWCLREQEEIDTQRPTRDKILTECGVKFSREYWLETYDLDDDDLAPEAETPAPLATQPAVPAQEGEPVEEDDVDEEEDDAPPPAMAAPAPARDAQSLIDTEMARDDTPAQQAAMERLLEPIVSAFADGLTPEEIMGRMDDWYGMLDDSLMQDLLTRGIAAADALGRIEVAGEGGA
jgi:phage gp29-like protein